MSPLNPDYTALDKLIQRMLSNDRTYVTFYYHGIRGIGDFTKVVYDTKP